MHKIRINQFEVSNNLPFFLIAGPCQMESRDHALFMAEKLDEITKKLNIPLVYKSSYDKANRTSLKGPRGVGLEKSLEIFAEIRANFGLPVITDTHTEAQCEIISEVVDIIQIPAFLCRQTDLLVAAAKTGKIINVKKGQFVAPWDMKNVGAKLKESGAQDIMLCDRGTCFGYNNLVSDMRGLPIMAEQGDPIVFDATHSVQQPGGMGNSSGGDRRFVEILARAALSTKIAGIFMEVHQDPDNAPSDGPCMVRLDDLENILQRLKALDHIVKQF
ncbi:MAG: 3-deoxy-8-phosphooctulonate synthase [Rickettsiaceae bacterium]|nr:3-deoxy-8-phosphooctulonate synthase [Rickettsiaceae bacterium]